MNEARKHVGMLCAEALEILFKFKVNKKIDRKQKTKNYLHF
jgi:hypothetical protein